MVGLSACVTVHSDAINILAGLSACVCSTLQYGTGGCAFCPIQGAVKVVGNRNVKKRPLFF